MRTSSYLIVGGGLTADGACKGIREVDPSGKIVLVTEDPHPPYARPPLSKALWKGADEARIWRATEDLGVDVQLGRRITALDLSARVAVDDQGERYSYERLLLATGGRPRRLPFGGDEVIYFRTLDDYRHLRTLADQGADFVVIGGGFIGSEIAAALALNGCPVKMVFPEPGIGARIFPASLSAALNDYYRGRGVELLPGSSVIGIEDGRVLPGTAGRSRRARLSPESGLSRTSNSPPTTGLPIRNGIVVDAFGRVDGREDVFAAGDVARFPVAALGMDMRVEHEDHAKSHGRRVGANMAGADRPYDHLPFFYSDLFDLGYEAVGELDCGWTRFEMERNASLGKNVFYYLDGERRPRGVLLWNSSARSTPHAS